MSAHFLKGAALLSRELEFQDAVLAEGLSAVSWDKFEHFILDSFGLLQPATEIRFAYYAMVQSDYDNDNALEQWWTDVKQVYKKSLQYELNQLATVTVHTDSGCEPDVRLDIASESEHDDDYLLTLSMVVRTPPSVWDARKKSQACYRCGEPGHRAQDCDAEF
ncbi:TPA: hypothetical protein ACH3X1_007477 [Trebouxia sp. C0004]